MARQILPIAGQIIGGMVGGPMGAAIGGAIGSSVGAYVDPIRHQGPKLGEARAQTAQEGVYRPLVFGTGAVAGNVIHRSPRKVVRHRESVGKGGRDTVDSDRGYRTFAIRIAEAHNPDGYQLLRIWENETLVYDVRPESEIPDESAEYAEKFRFYEGTHDQLPDPDLEAYLGVGNVNSYRGSCYIVFGNFDLTDYADMVPQYRFEIASEPGLTITEAIAMGGITTSAAVLSTFSSDGTSWSDPPMAGGASGSYLVAHPAGMLTWSVTGGRASLSTNYTDWVQVGPDLGSWSKNRQSFPYGNFVGISSSGGGIAFSSDMVNWGVVSTGLNAGGTGLRNIASNRTAALVYYRDPDEGGLGRVGRGSPGFSGGWTPAGFIPLYQLGDHYMSCNDDVFAIAGSTEVGTSGSAVVARSIDFGDNWTPYVFSGSSASRCLFVGPGKGSSWVALLDNREIWTSSDDCSSFQNSGFVTPQTPTGLTFNGSLYIVACGRETETQARIYTSPNGDEWTERSQPLRYIDRLAAGSPVISGEVGMVPLRSVISWCHSRVGHVASSYNVESIEDEMDGVVFADGYSARDAITTLLPIYNLDASEHDRGVGYRINYIKRGDPVLRTLTFDDLVDEPEQTVREDPMDRPRVLHMAFESPVTGYTAGKASIQRISPDVKLVNEVSTYVPVTFKDVDEAWKRADVQMRVAWTEVHGERTFSIADDQIDIVPTDVIALSRRGQVQRLRVLRVEYVAGVMKIEAVADRQSNYTSHVTGIPLPDPEPPPPSLMGPAALAILDIPAIIDQHDRLGYYVAVSGTTEAYAGAVIQRQQNGEWSDVISLSRSQRSIMGALENTVPAASQHYTDTTNTVSVSLHMEDELEGLSQSQWLNKGGAFALETADGWEIMQYRDVEQDSNGVWHLTHLSRGRLNTDPDEHLPGARFVLLDEVHFIEADVGMIGEHLTLRAAAVGRSPETAAPETITYQGNSQHEFPCAHLTAEIDSDGMSLACVPRDRFGTEQHPLRSINHDGFRWTATDGDATVTTDTDTPSASLDVSGMSLPITATVAQLNRFTGAGPDTSEQIE